MSAKPAIPSATRRLPGAPWFGAWLAVALAVTSKPAHADEDLYLSRGIVSQRSALPWPGLTFRDPLREQLLPSAVTPELVSTEPNKARAPLLLPGGNCGVRDAEDPRFAAVKALATLRPGRFEILECAPVDDSSAAPLEATVFGPSHELAHEVLSNLALIEGFAITLEPVGQNLMHIDIRLAAGTARGIRWRNLRKVEVTGTFMRGDQAQGLLALLGRIEDELDPAQAAERLATLGYSTRFIPKSVGHLEVDVEPKPILRWVKSHHLSPLSERELISQLSLAARPGALSRGTCVPPSQVRGRQRPPICEAHDISCRQWEEEEVRRIETFLFDRGYLRGKVSLALACGTDKSQATLHVFVDKGPVYRLSTSRIRVQLDQNRLNAASRRAIARAFVPKAFLVFPTAVTRSFINSQKEKVRENLAKPNQSALNPIRAGLYPFPEANVTTSYDSLTRDNAPASPRLRLDVRISLGQQLQTHFSPAKRGGKPLRFSQDKLEQNLKLFERQESPSQVVADQEAANLRAFYQSKGYLLANVSGEYAAMGSLHQLRFGITEGPHVRIRELKLERAPGVPTLAHERIERSWQENRELSRLGHFSDAKAVAELGRLTEFYQREGYACARAYLRLAFWPQGFVQAGASVRISAVDLLRGSGRAAWIDGFDATGLAGLTRQDRARLYVRLEVDPGPRFVTAHREDVTYLENPFPASRQTVNVPTRTTGAWSAQRIFRATDLHAGLDEAPGGVPVHLGLQRNVVDQVIERYRDNGYPLADAELGWTYVDGQGNPRELDDVRQLAEKPEVCRDVAYRRVVEATPVLRVYEGRRGVFGKILIRGNFKTRTATLRRELKFKAGQDYNLHKVTNSREQIESLGITNRTEFHAYPIGCAKDSRQPCQIFHVLRVDEARDYFAEIRYGVGSATLNPLYGFIRPNFPNLFGTAWNLELEGSWGVDVEKLVPNTDLCAGLSCYERRARTTLSRAHLPGTKVGLELGGHFQRRVTPARGEVETISANVRTTWRPTKEWNFYAGYRFQRANISKDLVKPVTSDNTQWLNRQRAVVRDDTGLFESGIALTRVDNAYNPERGYLTSIEGGLASPWLGGSGWWAKMDLSWQHFIGIPRTGERLSLRYSLRYGQLFPMRQLGTNIVPEVWRYYGGGSSDLGLRGILPETMLLDIERIELPFGGAVLRPRAQGGHIRAIGTLALQVVSMRDFFLGGKLAHSVFYDFGVLTHAWRTTDLTKAYRHSIGVNLVKWNINIATISFGYAILLGPNRSLIDDRNGRPFFEVGITF